MALKAVFFVFVFCLWFVVYGFLFFVFCLWFMVFCLAAPASCGMVYGLALQSRHSEERGVYSRPKSWLGQRFDFFCLLFFVCGLLFFVCGLWFVVCGLLFVVCDFLFVVCGL